MKSRVDKILLNELHLILDKIIPGEIECETYQYLYHKNGLLIELYYTNDINLLNYPIIYMYFGIKTRKPTLIYNHSKSFKCSPFKNRSLYKKIKKMNKIHMIIQKTQEEKNFIESLPDSIKQKIKFKQI